MAGSGEEEKLVNPSEKAQLYMQLAAWEKQKADGRRSAEWQINIALWGVLSLLISTNLAARLGNCANHRVLINPLLNVTVHLAILAVYVLFWSRWLHDANWRDREHGARYRNEVDDYAQGEKQDLDCVEQPRDRSFAQQIVNVFRHGKRCNVSGTTQCVVTAALAILNMLLWLCT